MNSLTSGSSKRSYDSTILRFYDSTILRFYDSLIHRLVLLRASTRLQRDGGHYRIALERHAYAPSTINLRLAATRRLGYEPSDCGLLSPDLAAGIGRVSEIG